MDKYDIIEKIIEIEPTEIKEELYSWTVEELQEYLYNLENMERLGSEGSKKND